MKYIWLLATFAFFVLVGASLWLGGVNQDEGWYLYASQLVSEGKILYADFSFTQAPLLPTIYGVLANFWVDGGLLSARILTSIFGLVGILFICALVRQLVDKEEDKNLASLIVFLLLANNLYHLYYLAIPKTYALASFFLSVGFYLFTYAIKFSKSYLRAFFLFTSGLALSFAAGTRISLGIILAVVGFALLFKAKDFKLSFLFFGIGGALGLVLVYGPYLINNDALAGLIEAQKYHTSRDGFDLVFLVGSLSRLVRWYTPIFIFLGLGIASLFLKREKEEPKTSNDSFIQKVLIFSFICVFIVQILAPHPYEDYQTPIMFLLAVFSIALLINSKLLDQHKIIIALLALGLTWAGSFGSPLLEKWTTNGQDRFWTLVKEKSELAQLREVAKEIEKVDPNGKTLLTQDLYLAIETKRKVPKGLEMGPFSILSNSEWEKLLSTATPKVAALSGYTFAIDPPSCNERLMTDQLHFWNILKKRYSFFMKEEMFGQQSTSLLILKRK